MVQLNRRPQVNSFGGAVGIQPSPIQSDLYTPPEQRVAGTKAASLANALGSFNQALVGAGSAFAANKQQSGPEADIEAARIMAQQSQGAWSEAVRNGGLPAIDDPFVRMAVERSAGEMRGTEWMNSIQDRIASGEIDVLNQDMDELLTGLMQEELAALEGAPQHVLAGFMATTANFRNWGIELQQEQLSVQANQERYQTVFDQFTMTGQQLLTTAGVTPDAFAAQMHQQYSNLNGVLHVPYGELDGELVNYAASIATTHPEFAIALLNQPRSGANGEVIPAISGKAETAAQVQNILATASRAMNLRQDQATIDGVRTTNISMLASGTPMTSVRDFTYVDANGQTQTYTRDQQVTDAWRQYQAERSADPTRSNWTADQVFQDDLRVVTQNGIVHDQWKDILEAVPGRINETTLSDPEQLGGIMQAVDLYQRLIQYSPTYLGGLVDDDTKTFFDAFLAAKNAGGQDDTTALNTAYNIAVRGADTVFIGEAALRDAVEAQFGEVANRTGWFDPSVRADPALFTRIYTLARVYMEGGANISEASAVTRAIETIRSTSIEVNRFNIETRGMMFGSDFIPTANDFIKDVYDSVLTDIYPDLEMSDVQMVHTSNGVFILKDATTGESLWADANGDGQAGVIRFDLRSLEQFRERQTHLIQEGIIETQNANQEASQGYRPTGNAAIDAMMMPDISGVTPGQDAAPSQPEAAPVVETPSPAAAAPEDAVEFVFDEQAARLIEGNTGDLPRNGTPEWAAARQYFLDNQITGEGGVTSITRENFYAGMVAWGMTRVGFMNFLAEHYGWTQSEIAQHLNSLRP